MQQKQPQADSELSPLDDRLLTVQDVAAILSVSSTTVYELCASGQLPHLKIGAKGGRYRFTKADVDAYLERQRVVGPGVVQLPTRGGERRGQPRKEAAAVGGFSLLRKAGWRG